jgi:hypothetical protein
MIYKGYEIKCITKRTEEWSVDGDGETLDCLYEADISEKNLYIVDNYNEPYGYLFESETFKGIKQQIDRQIMGAKL